MTRSIPLTVIGGYLGAGKTTLLNRLLRDPGPARRRLGVIVNDFGDVGVDAALLADAADPGGVVDLPNGCVCCGLADGLATALSALADRDALDHVVIEASGVADPAAVGHWATVPPYRPGGVIVLAAADAVRRQAADRYVGGEVRGQLAGADLIVMTRTDRCGSGDAAAVRDWLATISAAPILVGPHGDVAPDVVLGVSPPTASRPATGAGTAGHGAGYETRTWTSDTPIDRLRLDRLLADLDDAVVRAKGVVRLDDGTAVDVQLVGRTVDIRPHTLPVDRSVLVTIAIAAPA